MRRSVILAVVLVGIGCERPPERVSLEPAASQPASQLSQVATGQSTLEQPTLKEGAGAQPLNPPSGDPPVADTLPAPVFIIQEEHLDFPPGKLVLEDRNGRTVALLFSEDPPQAINPGYAGHSFYLELQFPELLTEVWGQEYTFEAPSMERFDSPSGVFTHGNKWQLQPYQIKVEFRRVSGESGIAWLSGTFNRFSTRDEHAPAGLVPVTAKIPLSLK